MPLRLALSAPPVGLQAMGKWADFRSGTLGLLLLSACFRVLTRPPRGEMTEVAPSAIVAKCSIACVGGFVSFVRVLRYARFGRYLAPRPT